MQQMFRRLSPFVLLLGLLLAAEPLLHNHPIQSSIDGAGSTACAICATGTLQLPTVTVHVAAPQLIAYQCVSAVVPVVTAYTPHRLSPRAPPAA